MKKIVMLSVTIIVAFYAVFYFMDKDEYTTFDKVVFDKINEDDLIWFTIENHSENTMVSIRDRVVIDKILKNFSGVELKKVSESDVPLSKREGYEIIIEIIQDGKVAISTYHRDNSITIYNKHNKPKNNRQYYHIVNGIDLITPTLKIIKEENLEWIQ
ncbi:hypothetical protein [Brevibacillus daliensis]|uniref:hypothetical protein n=1 Tax=Brevibacillus daliensis TaxID=2892995 RepID=UPI001E5511DD|nr:hypothetical protein [Brevibacillus daliensis]